MAFCIEKFTTWFCFVFCTGKSSPEDESLCQLPINTQRIKDIIRKLLHMYRIELIAAFQKAEGDFMDYSCYEAFLKGILSKCIELSKKPDELRFLLVCTFIYGIVSPWSRHENRCFMFSKMASVCLLAVYNRYYKNLFDFESFEAYCINLNTILERRLVPAGRRKLKPFNDEHLEELMADLKELGDEDLRIEESMLIDLTEHLPKEYYPATARGTFLKEETIGQETSSSEESSEEAESSSIDKEDSDVLNRICEHCGWNCYGFASSI